MDAILGIPVSTLAPSGALTLVVIAIVTAFIRGWIISKWVVQAALEAAETRATEWKELYLIEKQRADILTGIADKMTVQGETLVKILNAMPHVEGETR